MEVKWVVYKGKKILYTDYRGAKNEDEMIGLLQQSMKIYEKTPGKLLTMANFTGTYGSKRFMDEIKKYGKEQISKKSQRGAVIGISGVKKILYNAYLLFSDDKTSALFDTEEEAMEWLVK